MLQSEYDVIVRHKRLKIFLITLTTIMVVGVVLFIGKQLLMVSEPLNVSESPKSDVLKLPDPVLNTEKSFDLQGAELETFFQSDTPEAQMLRSGMELQSSQK